MSWDELYPIVSEQAFWAVLRYDPRRKDKIQELVCQAYEKFIRDENAGKEIKKQEYKCFITQRAKEVDQRSICKNGYGGTSTTDVLSFYRRRTDSETEVIEFDDWMTMKYNSRETVEETISFQIDFKDWQKTLTEQEKEILSHLMQGYKANKIAEILQLAYHSIKTIIKKLKQEFLNYFGLGEFAIP
jgi:hypothetical protein